jgi:hypothetical protein
MMTKDQAITAIVRGLPHPYHISDLDTTSEENAVRFTWRRDRFRLSLAGRPSVEEVDDGFLSGSNIAILMEALIQRAFTDMAMEAQSP